MAIYTWYGFVRNAALLRLLCYLVGVSILLGSCAVETEGNVLQRFQALLPSSAHSLDLAVLSDPVFASIFYDNSSTVNYSQFYAASARQGLSAQLFVSVDDAAHADGALIEQIRAYGSLLTPSSLATLLSAKRIILSPLLYVTNAALVEDITARRRELEREAPFQLSFEIRNREENKIYSDYSYAMVALAQVLVERIQEADLEKVFVFGDRSIPRIADDLTVFLRAFARLAPHIEVETRWKNRLLNGERETIEYIEAQADPKHAYLLHMGTQTLSIARHFSRHSRIGTNTMFVVQYWEKVPNPYQSIEKVAAVVELGLQELFLQKNFTHAQIRRYLE